MDCQPDLRSVCGGYKAVGIMLSPLYNNIIIAHVPLHTQFTQQL